MSRAVTDDQMMTGRGAMPRHADTTRTERVIP